MTTFGTGLRVATLTLATALLATLAPAISQAHGGGHDGHSPGGGSFPAVLQLPNGFQPEGIDIRHKTAYFGSLADGDIYAVDLRTGAGKVISQGPGTASVGLKIDHRGRLFVAGGPAGDARVVDTRTGAILKSYQLATAGSASFINDVALVRKTAWFTDSANPVLYGLRLGDHGKLPDAAVKLMLSGDFVKQPGFNLNGIAGTPDGKALLAVQSNTGLLFRIDPKTGVAKKVDLGGYLLTGGDGLLVIGRTLYVVQNQSNLVAVIRLNHGATAGMLTKTLTNPNFDVPTTVASFGKWLYLPNARFSTTPTPTTTYTAVRVTR